MLRKLALLVPLLFDAHVLPAADFPTAEITNGQIRARLCLPDAKSGCYRASRFDWSGVISSLEYKGHNYYGPWFDKVDPPVRDFTYQGDDVVVGAAGAITGPVEDFQPAGWDEAQAGRGFLKIGVGILRKPESPRYDFAGTYDPIVAGTWATRTAPDSVEFTHTLADGASRYGYVYRKTVRLVPGKPDMVLDHSLRNTGTRAIRTTVYNHNFLVLDHQPPGPGLVITLPFPVRAERPFDPQLANIDGSRILYQKTLTGHDRVQSLLAGFEKTVAANEIRIEDTRAGAGLVVRTNRPLVREMLWSIRTVVAVEPYIAIEVEPGQEFTWTSTYHYYTLDK